MSLIGRLFRREHNDWAPQPGEAAAAQAPYDPVAEIEERFGKSCPVCHGLLGRAADQDYNEGRYEQAPAMLLEVGPGVQVGTGTEYPWRLSYVDGNPWYTTSDLPFTPYEVDFVYLLCGNGHIFAHSAPIYGGPAGGIGRRIEGWNMAAAIGPTGSGKTYLMLRTLSQSFVNENNLFPSDGDRLELRELSPLEQVPTVVRERLYGLTLANGAPIPATQVDAEGTPFSIMNDQLPDLVREMQRVIEDTVVDGEQRAASWGKNHRQPLVLRTDTGGRSIWTGVADLPGELFTDAHENRRENMRLRLYDALVWVIDPVLAASAQDWLPKDSDEYMSILDGSLRPGSIANMRMGDSDIEKAGLIRQARDEVQVGLGRILSRVDGRYSNDANVRQSLLVAITKCDVIHAALAKPQPDPGHRYRYGLERLGPRDVVRNGVIRFLVEEAARLGRGDLLADAHADGLLRQINPGAQVDASFQVARARIAAEGLLRHYSDPEAFWNLVHTGDPDEVRIGSGGEALHWLLTVPSVGDHLDASMLRGSSSRLLGRDLVMSALGAGVACGLGHLDAVYTLLARPQRDLRFFLCSPLTTMPVAHMRAGRPNLAPLDPAARFPRAEDRSAALTQLLMGVLGKARQWPE